MFDSPVGFWPYLFWPLLPRLEIVDPPIAGWLGFGSIMPAAPVAAAVGGVFPAAPSAGCVNARYQYPAAVLVGYIEKDLAPEPPVATSFGDTTVVQSPTSGHQGALFPRPVTGKVFGT